MFSVILQATYDMASKAIFFQVMALLAVHLVMTRAGGAQEQPPEGCVCRCPDNNPSANPQCYTRGCSAGTNDPNCNNGAVLLVYRPPAPYTNDPPILTTGGCSCPGACSVGYFDADGDSNSTDGRTVDGFGDADDIAYGYSSCAAFGQNIVPFGASADDVNRAIRCCRYCCQRKGRY